MRLASLMLAVATLAAALPPVVAQSRPDTAAIKAAMQKLNYLAGNWAGEATVMAGPGKTLKVAQTEEVVYKLDGLVMLIEGTGRDESGKIVFNALATVTFDPATNSYRIRAYRDGHYLDTEMKLREGGFEWGYAAGPATVRNVMTLEGGKWVEITNAKMPDGREFRSVEMRLDRK